MMRFAFTENRAVGTRGGSPKKNKAGWKVNIGANRDRSKPKPMKEGNQDSGNIDSTMRRVIDLQQLSKDLWYNSCKVPLSL